MTDEHTAAWLSGRAAYENGKPFINNPYDRMSTRWWQWRHGYLQGVNDDPLAEARLTGKAV